MKGKKKRDLDTLFEKISQLEARFKRLEENEIPHLSTQVNDLFALTSKKADDSLVFFHVHFDELSRRMNKHIEEHEKKRQTLGEQIYDLHGSELEKEHMDKIVAIDIESGVIAGMGNSVTEAYNQAKEKFGEKQYYFKRIGRRYLYRFR